MCNRAEGRPAPPAHRESALQRPIAVTNSGNWSRSAKLSPKRDNDLELLYLFCQEGWAREALDDYDAEREALSGFVLSAVLMRDPIIKVIRRDLRKVFPDVKVSVEQIRAALETAVLRREVADGDNAVKASRLVERRIKKHDSEEKPAESEEADPQV
jgi:hypothetical protein